MKSIKQVSSIMVFWALSQVPAMAVWFNPGMPEKPRILLVTALSVLFLLGVVENFGRKLSLSYPQMGARLPERGNFLKTALTGLAAGAAGVVFFAAYLLAIKNFMPAVYLKLSTAEGGGYLSSLVDWGMTFSPAGVMALTVGMLLVVAAEELLFRGLILNYLLREESGTKAVIWSSVFFALAHLRPVSILPVFVFGLMLARAYRRTGSLLASLTGHFAYNMSLILLGPAFG